MKAAEKKGGVKIGDEFYTWEYHEQKHVLHAWNKQGATLFKQEMTDDEFEKLSVAAYIKERLNS